MNYDDWKADVANREGSAPEDEDDTGMSDWEQGYEQAAFEVLDEVRQYDRTLYLHLLSRFPGWRKLMQAKAVRP